MNTFFTLFVLGLGNPPAPAPLHCPTPLTARGDIKGGPPLTQTFELTNRGAGTLTITKVQAGCGCVGRTLSAQVLKPGESATLALEVNTLTQPDGPNRWQAIVSYTVELGQPAELALAITANLSRDVTLTPPQVGFSTSSEATQVLTLTDLRRKSLTVVKAVSSSPHLTAELASPVVGSQKITLKLTADAPAGHRDEVVVLQTDDAAYPEFRVPVRVLKKAPGQVVAAPEEVAVRFAAEQDEVSALVQLRTPDGKQIRIDSAVSDFPAVSTKFSTIAGPVATVRVIVGGTAAVQAGSCQVRIVLAEPVGQVVVVPVSWTSAAKK